LIREFKKNLIKSALFSAFFVATGCSEGVQTLRLSGQTMGTSYHLTIVGAGQKFNETEILTATERVLEDVNQKMSSYRSDSELASINQSKQEGWQKVSAELLYVLELSQLVAEQSRGAFDITIAPLVNLWGFGPLRRRDQLPEKKEIEEALASVGWQTIELDGKLLQMRRKKNITIDLSAIAKGYGVDRIAKQLQAMGYSNFLVEVGGEVKVAGHSARGKPWRLAIEKPNLLGGEVYQAIALNDGAIATSGGYRNYFEIDDTRYSHTIDPRTGFPITHDLVSVTVIMDDAGLADAWATALTVLGPVRGLVLAEEKALAAFFISGSDNYFSSAHTAAFSRYMD
jgi:thiamine biosynthesis lipoprotein